MVVSNRSVPSFGGSPPCHRSHATMMDDRIGNERLHQSLKLADGRGSHPLPWRVVHPGGAVKFQAWRNTAPEIVRPPERHCLGKGRQRYRLVCMSGFAACPAPDFTGVCPFPGTAFRTGPRRVARPVRFPALKTSKNDTVFPGGDQRGKSSGGAAHPRHGELASAGDQHAGSAFEPAVLQFQA